MRCHRRQRVRVRHPERAHRIAGASPLRVVVIIPTYDEAENLPKLVSALFLLPLDLHVLVVDDNSPDGTGRIADELAQADSRIAVIHRAGKLGLRSAYIMGMQRA